MPIIGLSLSATRIFESPLDPDKGTPEATRFTIATLDSRVAGRLRDLGTTVKIDPNSPDDEVETTINMEDVNFQTVQFGVSGWENFVDKERKTIEFKTVGRRLGGKSYEVIDPEVLCRVPTAVIRELADEVRKENELSEDGGKN